MNLERERKERKERVKQGAMCSGARREEREDRRGEEKREGRRGRREVGEEGGLLTYKQTIHLSHLPHHITASTHTRRSTNARDEFNLMKPEYNIWLSYIYIEYVMPSVSGYYQVLYRLI